MYRLAALPLVILAGIALLATPADATTVNVSIIDDAFSPVTVTVQQGATVKWQNNGQSVHTTTSLPLQSFWDSGDLSHGQTFSQPFPNAGTFRYECTIHLFHGVVKVRMAKSGSAGSGWTVRWSTASSAAGHNFDVVVKRPGQSGFHAFRSATTALKAFFNPTKAGTYKFEARTRIASSGAKSGFSPVLTLTIS
jgi:plastocyanin